MFLVKGLRWGLVHFSLSGSGNVNVNGSPCYRFQQNRFCVWSAPAESNVRAIIVSAEGSVVSFFFPDESYIRYRVKPSHAIETKRDPMLLKKAWTNAWSSRVVGFHVFVPPLFALINVCVIVSDEKQELYEFFFSVETCLCFFFILRPCLVHPENQKIFKIPHHIESCSTCMKH